MLTPLHPSDSAHVQDLVHRITALPSPDREPVIAAFVAFVAVMRRLNDVLEPDDLAALLVFMQGAHPSTWPQIAQVVEQYEDWRRHQPLP
jgi:hypothetical protein